MDGITFDRTLEAIYAAPGNPPAWESLVHHLTRAFTADDVHIVALDQTGQIETDFVSAPAAGDEYRAHYAALDTAVHRLIHAQDGVAASEEAFLSPAERARCPVHNELLPRYGVATRLWVKGPIDRTGTFVLALLRARHRHPFAADHCRAAERLHPHLRQAMSLHRTIERGRRAGRTLDAVFDAMPTAVLVLSRTGQILHCNAPARRLFDAAALRLDQGQLAVPHPPAAARLRRAIVAATARPPHSSALVLHDPACNRTLRLRIIPASDAIAAGQGAATIIFVDDHASPATLDPAALADAGLTPAEAEVLAALLAGATPQELAHRTGRSPHTIRAQLRSTLAKTGTHRQSELLLHALHVAGLLQSNIASG